MKLLLMVIGYECFLRTKPVCFVVLGCFHSAEEEAFADILIRMREYRCRKNNDGREFLEGRPEGNFISLKCAQMLFYQNLLLTNLTGLMGDFFVRHQKTTKLSLL